MLKQIIRTGRGGEEFLARERELSEGGSEAQLYEEVYPHHAETALLERDEPPFDVVVMDEAQDLIDQRKLPLLDLLVRGGLAGGRWCLFGDFTRQALYSPGGGGRDPVADLQAYGRRGIEGARSGGLQPVRARLTRNCRNTRNIAEATALIAGFETPPFRPGVESGIDVDCRYWGPSRPWEDLLAETVEDLTSKNKVATADIVILTPGRPEREALRKLERLDGHPLVDCTAGRGVERPGIKVTTIHAFKGMESPVVIIPGIDRDLDEWQPSLFYVGMSRARSFLGLIVHERARDAVERLIGKRHPSIGSNGAGARGGRGRPAS